MKYLLVLVAVGVLVWMLMARQRSRRKNPDQAPPAAKPGAPAAMLACAHCGLLLPSDEALNGADGQVFCSQAHRLAGPR